MRSIACLLALLTTSFVLVGCVSVQTGNDFCLVSQAIYIGDKDVLTDGTARDILAHNELGHRLCDWPTVDED